MKKILFSILMILILTGIAAAQVGPGGTLYVSNKTLELKASMGMFASTTGTLSYGDQVTVISVNGKNVEVKSNANPSITGWAAAANFTARQIAASTSSTTSAREVALAGKGFNQDVEDLYRGNGIVNYDDVDKVEAITVSQTALFSFLQDSSLALGQ